MFALYWPYRFRTFGYVAVWTTRLDYFPDYCPDCALHGSKKVQSKLHAARAIFNLRSYLAGSQSYPTCLVSRISNSPVEHKKDQLSGSDAVPGPSTNVNYYSICVTDLALRASITMTRPLTRHWLAAAHQLVVINIARVRWLLSFRLFLVLDLTAKISRMG
ncbi:hypothetical protein BDP27DRAFT_924048 [Rhodocollybia butyracea]|uniref:Uncharacterized protein n=1 Tax=Rhodocollybia butyracea TaxID=206335 RepID=A0A9P5PKK9_9AGAR|nr:hypothetical protein BDP27DRAFT_924048 [Rhodocollybia butyracea]